ncbi:MAG TPA: hypothetical protein VHY91_02015, partial [Pirellulales bacterium]|nr:hypothetical protein [Pirellulales bacterium]
ASRALFARLDTNHDDKLSAGECQHAFDALHPLDLNEVDLFSQNQLMTDEPSADYSVQPRRNRQRAAPVRLAVTQLKFSKSEPSLAWADRIRQHFAPAGSTTANLPQHLRGAVMLYDDATLAMIDGDGDGMLDREELAHLMRRPMPNLEMIVNLAEQGSIQATETRLDRACRFEPATASPDPIGPARLTAGGEQIEMTAGEFVDPTSGDRGAEFVNNLKQFDQDKNDYLDEREARQMGQINFKALDANGDGKLFFDDIAQYINAQAAVAAVRLTVAVVDHDHALFESLDTNGDRQLGRRELGKLLDRLKDWDRDGDGQLAFGEVPRRYTLRVEQDQVQFPFDQTFSIATFSTTGTLGFRSNSGPAWFAEMDRNSDGDVSRREFLGTTAQFRQIDTDGDELIDPDEALRATPVAEKAAAKKPAVEKTEPVGTPAAEGGK